jgi:hypothetical protein
MADYPPISRFYVASYAANDRDYPVVAIRLDPRTAGYKVPEDLSPHPDSKRYPNHVFTGAQPASGDQIVTHIYEILPAPWVPFTRYDDDLGPIQGRRRSVKNEGQVARLGPDQRVNYEAREGSAIVYTEIEEAWSIKTDDDGNSLFPIRDRDFYDASRGAVQERRQLFVPTGEEEGTLENVNGVITQTSYEPYNEFLSVKIVQTYKVDGPQLVGKTTNEEGQLVTVTTQRRGADNYVPPSPTAIRTVEVSREDAESLVERIVDTPEVFPNKSFSKEIPDPAPTKFRIELPTTTSEITKEGANISESDVNLGDDDIAKSVQQVSVFTKRTRTTSRDQASEGTLIGKQTGQWGEETVTETYNEDGTIDVGYTILSNRKTPLGKGKFLGEKVQVLDPISLTETKKDSETGVIFTTTKTLVAAGTPLPSVSDNQIAEITPIDAYNSIQIITSVDDIPPPETFESSIDVSYPDILEEIGIDWDFSSGGGAGSSGGLNVAEIIANEYNWSAQANANASARIIGAVYTKIKRGHRGSVRARVTRTYYNSPPTNIPTATLFQPVYGTVTIKGKGVSLNSKTGIGGFGGSVTGSSGGYSEEINNFANSVQFGPFCHSNPTLQNATAPIGESATFTASSGSVPAGSYPATFAQATATAEANLELGSSSPLGSSLVNGYSHIAAVRVEKWRFGIWIQEVYTAFHP